MALITPIALPTDGFDATDSHVFYFQANGGDQVSANTLTILNSNNVIVYQQTQQTYSFSHVLPANTLTNGEQYTFYFNTHSTVGGITSTSADSNTVLCYCYTTPTFTITDPTENGYLYNRDNTFIVTYNQPQGELLRDAIATLYDDNGEDINTVKINVGDFIAGTSKTFYFSGFVDRERYSVKVKGTTVNNTPVESNTITFIASYQTQSTYFTVKATNDCQNGRIKIESNISLVAGHTNMLAPTYINNQILLQGDDYVEWNENFRLFSNQMSLLSWWTPVQTGKIMEFVGADASNRIEFWLMRDPSTVHDFVRAKIWLQDGAQYYETDSNKVPCVNNKSKILTYISADGSDITLEIDVLEREDNVIVDDGASNIQYNRLVDFQYSPKQVPNNNRTLYEDEDIGVGFQIKSVRIMNSIVDQMYVSNTPHFTKTTTMPSWGIDTILRPLFDGTLNAGNVDFTIEELQALVVKKREINTLQWFDVYQKEVTDIHDTNILVYDTYIRSNVDYEYVVIPILNGLEGSYSNVASVHSHFSGFFISDINTNMSLKGVVLYPSRASNQQIGILQPYGKKYPKIVMNGATNYETLQISGTILNETDYRDQSLNRLELTEQTLKWNAFLTNGKAKFLKDWNGNIWIGNITSPPSITYGAGLLIPTISFTLTEQGSAKDPQAYHTMGLINF